MTRPAEISAVAAAIAALIARIAGVDDANIITYMATAIGVIPAVVTFVVSNGGLSGILRIVWKGRMND